MLAVDIESSAGRGDVALLQMREALARIVGDALDNSGIDKNACAQEDLGDGVRVIFPRAVRKSSLLYPLVHELTIFLKAHNRLAGQPIRMRLRAVLHAGDVYLEDDGIAAGGSLEVLARMLDAQPLREALAAAPEDAPLALLISQHFYDETVPHGHLGIEPETFRKVAFTTKKYSADAWLHVPCVPVSPEDSEPAEPESAKPESERTGGSIMVNDASDHGVIYGSQHGTQHIHHTS